MCIQVGKKLLRKVELDQDNCLRLAVGFLGVMVEGTLVSKYVPSASLSGCSENIRRECL